MVEGPRNAHPEGSRARAQGAHVVGGVAVRPVQHEFPARAVLRVQQIPGVQQDVRALEWDERADGRDP